MEPRVSAIVGGINAAASFSSDIGGSLAIAPIAIAVYSVCESGTAYLPGILCASLGTIDRVPAFLQKGSVTKPNTEGSAAPSVSALPPIAEF
jgi:hypothetical protein